MAKQSCGTCLLADFPRTAHNPPRFAKNAGAKCKWEAPTIIWPDSILMRDRTFFTTWVTPTMGTACPCYQPREKT